MQNIKKIAATHFREKKLSGRRAKNTEKGPFLALFGPFLALRWKVAYLGRFWGSYSTCSGCNKYAYPMGNFPRKIFAFYIEGWAHTVLEKSCRPPTPTKCAKKAAFLWKTQFFHRTRRNESQVTFEGLLNAGWIFLPIRNTNGSNWPDRFHQKPSGLEIRGQVGFTPRLKKMPFLRLEATVSQVTALAAPPRLLPKKVAFPIFFPGCRIPQGWV